MQSLSRLLRPQSIALIGGAWSENVLEQLKKSGFQGSVWPVHPSKGSLGEHTCYQSLDQLPAPPDAAFIGVNRHLTVEIVKQLSRMGAGGATCFASGFLESEAEDSGGANLQEQLVEAAGDMPILGPNCYGILNYLDNVTLWPDQHGGRPCEKGVAIIGQSSNILINMTMQKRLLPIAYAIAVGNQAQTGFSQIADHLLDDDRVTAIGLYIEGFGNIEDFQAFAQKAKQAGKPVVAIKSGKSEKSRIATLTHTASLAGGAAAASAFLKRLGIIEALSIETFLEVLKLMHQFGPLRGNSVSSISCSGGEAGLMSDLIAGTQIDFKDFSQKTSKNLKQVLGPIVTIANPLDYHTFIWGDLDAMTATYQAVFDDGFDLNIVVMDVPPTERCDMSAWDIPLQAVINATKNSEAKVALLATLPENLSEQISDRLLSNGVLPLHGMNVAIEAIDLAIRAGTQSSVPASPALCSPINSTDRVTLYEAEAKAALNKYGIQFPRSVSTASASELSTLSKQLKYPIVLKGLGVAHKSEAGAVALNINSEIELVSAANHMKNVTGFLVEEMITDPIAEILIGITRDETGLFLLTIGAGGTLTELLSDTANLIIPASRQQVVEAIQSLRIHKLLKGFRGKPPADLAAIADTIMKLQTYVLNHPDIIEIDINPILALENCAIAVDALIIQEETS